MRTAAVLLGVDRKYVAPPLLNRQPVTAIPGNAGFNDHHPAERLVAIEHGAA
jgi:hypothetical protein